MNMSSTPTLNLPPIIIALVLLFLPMPSRSQTGDPGELKFSVKHRVNAHGDEFNALAKSANGQWLFVGTEKGEVIIWNIARKQVERRLRQPSPIHLVATLSDPHYIIASGSEHHEPMRPLVRKWNVETGAFVDLQGLPPVSFPTALATNDTLIAVGCDDGTVLVWDATSEKILATANVKEVPLSLALIKRTLYIVSVNRAAIIADAASANAISKLSIDDPKKEATEFLKIPGRQWTAVGASPDGRLLSATYRSPGGGRTVVIEPDSKSELGTFSESIFVWTKPTNFLLFDWLDPSELVQIVKNGKVRSIKKFGRFKSDTSGRAFDLTGQVASDDGARAWATYRKGPALLEFTFASRKIKTLIGGPSGAYALSVSTPDGLLLTGGADGYVRLWKLEDFSLSKEYSVAPPEHFVTTVRLVPGGRQAIVGVKEIIKEQERIFPADPTEVILLDLETGERKKVLDLTGGRVNIDLIGNQLLYPEGDRVKLVTIAGQPIREFTAKAAILQTAVSDNGQWLAVFDSSQTLTIFEIQTGKQIVAQPTKADDAGPAVVTNDGRYVYKLAHGGELIRWDMQTGEITKSVLARVREMSSSVDFITLANNDEWLITAGNHGDVGIFDRATGSLVSYTQTSATAFWVEKVWVSGDRMILTTDTGVMYDGRLIK